MQKKLLKNFKNINRHMYHVQKLCVTILNRKVTCRINIILQSIVCNLYFLRIYKDHIL